MKFAIVKKSGKIVKNKEILEKKLKVKISIEGRKISAQGTELDEFLALKVFEALDLGFSIDASLMLCEQDFLLEKLEIKNLTPRRNLEQVRARIVGKDGRTKELIEELTDCDISLSGNEIGVIGQVERIKICMNALTKLVQGSKQSSVYSYLEKQHKAYHPEDLGLKINEE